MNQARKIIYHVLQVTCLSFVLLLACVSVITVVTSKAGLPGGIHSFVVLTGSMVPSIPIGSVVYVKKQNTYAIGDVITFQTHKGERVTHRIASVDNESFITQGDANSVSDSEQVQKNAIIGKTFFAVPYVGSIVLFAKTTLGFLTLVGIPLVSLLILELLREKNSRQSLQQVSRKQVRLFTQKKVPLTQKMYRS